MRRFETQCLLHQKLAPLTKPLNIVEKIYMPGATIVPSKDIVNERSFQTSLNALNFLLMYRMMDLYISRE